MFTKQLLKKEVKSGITIHFVNEFYYEGGIIKQFDCNIETKVTLVRMLQKFIN